MTSRGRDPGRPCRLQCGHGKKLEYDCQQMPSNQLNFFTRPAAYWLGVIHPKRVQKIALSRELQYTQTWLFIFDTLKQENSKRSSDPERCMREACKRPQCFCQLVELAFNCETMSHIEMVLLHFWRLDARLWFH